MHALAHSKAVLVALKAVRWVLSAADRVGIRALPVEGVWPARQAYVSPEPPASRVATAVDATAIVVATACCGRIPHRKQACASRLCR